MGRDPTAVFVFGYGSLAGEGTPCRLDGWRRRWGVAMDNRATIPGYRYFVEPGGARPPVYVAFLDIAQDAGAGVAGWAFAVDEERLAALDRRERNYARVDVTGELDTDLGGRVWAYAGLPSARERLAAGRSAGTAVIARYYAERVKEPPDLPLRDLRSVPVPP